LSPPLRLGLALGAGSARGWSHIGVLRALQAGGVEPDIVCGCSIGAFVGAAYVNGDLDKLEKWVSALRWQDVLGLLDLGSKGGLIKGQKLIDFFSSNFVDHDFSQLGKPFACVATDLDSGREVWLREGSVAAAVRASRALPGLFSPVVRDGRLLVDGALVNPVPVTMCQALGADLVIAVDLGSDRVGHAGRLRRIGDEPASWKQRLLQRIGRGNGASNGTSNGEANGDALPSLIEVLSSSLNIMQVRIARSRLAGEPADVLLAPRLAQIGLMEFHRGSEAIEEGAAAVERMWPVIRHALDEAQLD
jgi:NTE family protein